MLLHQATASINRKVGLSTLAAAQKFMSHQLDKPEQPEQLRAVEHLNRLLHETQPPDNATADARISRSVEGVAILTFLLSVLWLITMAGRLSGPMGIRRPTRHMSDAL